MRTVTDSTETHHLDHEQFDDYLEKTLKGPKFDHIEEHLLTCGMCRSECDYVQEYREIMRTALQSTREGQSPTRTDDIHSG